MKKKFSGAVCVSRYDNHLITNAYGFSDYSNGLLNDMYTRFNMAQGSSFFTAVLVMILREKGMLDLDDPIGKYLRIPLRNIDRDITIRQLLNQTSGVPKMVEDDNYRMFWETKDTSKIRYNADLVPFFLTKEMRFEKGTKCELNDTNFILLALIIETLTKKPLDQMIERWIIKPCRMNETGFYSLNQLPGNTANGMMEENDELISNIYHCEIKGNGASGAYTTCYDLCRFWKCLFSEDLISQESLDEMLKDQGHGYGLGLHLVQHKGKSIVVIAGERPGASMISSFAPHNGIQISVFSNNESDVKKIHDELGVDLW